jgi:hypothetical protein
MQSDHERLSRNRSRRGCRPGPNIENDDILTLAVAPFGNEDTQSLPNYFHQMTNLEDHPSNLWRVRTCDDLIHTAEAESLDHPFLLLGKPDAALD